MKNIARVVLSFGVLALLCGCATQQPPVKQQVEQSVPAKVDEGPVTGERERIILEAVEAARGRERIAHSEQTPPYESSESSPMTKTNVSLPSPNPSPPIVSVPVPDKTSTSNSTPERSLFPIRMVFFKKGVSIEQAKRDKEEILTKVFKYTSSSKLTMPGYLDALLELEFAERGYEHINSYFLPDEYVEEKGGCTVAGLP